PRTPWHAGPVLLEHLEGVVLDAGAAAAPFRLPVQWVCRPDQHFRGFAGTVASGRIAVGDPVAVAASGRGSTVARILLGRQERRAAVAGQSVLVTLADEIDASRGDMLVAADARPQLGDQCAAHLIWMDAEPLLPGR